MTTSGANQESEEAAGNVRTEEMITGVEDEGEIRTEERKEICAGTAHGNPRIHEEPREPCRKGDRSATVGHTPLQGRTRRERTLEASGRQKWTSRIRTSRFPGGHPRHDSRGTGKRRYQEGTREQYRGKPDWTGGRTKEELLSGSDRWHQEKHYDLRWRLYHPENRFKTEPGEDVVVYLPGARIEHVTERVGKIMGRGNGGTIVVHVGTNNTDKEETTAIVEKYRKLLKKTKQARLGQIILSRILPVCGNRIQGYRNSKRMAVNGMVERLCKEEDVGHVDMWDSFVGNEGLYFRDGLHLSGKGAAVLAEGLSGAVASGLGKVRYLN